MALFKISMALAVFFLLATTVKAQSFAGSDNFATINNWNIAPTINGAPVNYGSGFLDEHDSELHYVTNSGFSAPSQTIWEWTPGVAPITESWAMSMDVSNSVISTTGTDAEIGFGIADTNNLLGDNLDLTLASFQGAQEFRLNVTSGGGTATHSFAVTSTQNGAIELAFDAPSDTLQVLYSSSASNPSFSDLTNVPLDQLWNLQSTDSLTFFTIGASDDQDVLRDTDPAYGSNFKIADLSSAPEPSPMSMLLLGAFLLAVINLRTSKKQNS